jgi:hypothetical protein
LKFWIMPCETRNSANTRQIGHEQVVGDAHHIDPEVADGLAVCRAMPRTSAAAMAMPAAADVKLWNRQRDHLREIRHGRFAAVELPVGVGGEARGGVEGEVRRQAGQILRVERQVVLVAQDEIGEQHPDRG